jgi:hypothetical protein
MEKQSTESQKKPFEQLTPEGWARVTRALKFAREDDAKRAADPVAYKLGLIYRREKGK